MKKIILLILVLFFTACEESPTQNFRNGDIIFQDSPSSQSKAIKIATKSNYSHVGIIYINDGKSFVYEAVGPVILTPLKKWTSKGVNGMFVVKRLKNSDVLGILHNNYTVSSKNNPRIN
jgi:hypothetical protein